MRTRIWIDTDIGTDVDDALTLAYVLRPPGFELVGVSTVFGDVALRSRIARALLVHDEELRPTLRKAGYLTRDARKVDRTKVGLHKARKRPQYSKR